MLKIDVQGNLTRECEIDFRRDWQAKNYTKLNRTGRRVIKSVCNVASCVT